MTLLSRAKAMPLPEHTYDLFEDVIVKLRYHNLSRSEQHAELTRMWCAAREQIAAEGDEVIGRLCEALEAVQREFIDGHISASLWTDKQAEADLMARAALAEARKA